MKEEFQKIGHRVKSILTAHGLRLGDVDHARIEPSGNGYDVAFEITRGGSSRKISLHFSEQAQAQLAQAILKGNGADVVPVTEEKRSRRVDPSFDVAL